MSTGNEQFREPEAGEGPVIRDKRRIDPLTGALREQGHPPAPAGSPGSPGSVTGPAAPGAVPGDAVPTEAAPGDAVPTLADELDAARAALAERTADLQRVSAEYANYRRRVDRDREQVREAAVANVLTNLLPILDDLGRAQEHGELQGGFKAVADALVATVEKLGLQRYGVEGEPFDPTVHEALMHGHSPEVTEPTCVQILQPGYRIGERILRPARVSVADPET